MDATLFEKYNTPTKKTERGELQKEIMETLNINRISNRYKPLSMAFVGTLIQHIPTEDLYYTLSICKDAGHRAKNYYTGFSKKFYYEIRP